MSGALGLLHRRIIGQQILGVPEKLHVSIRHKGWKISNINVLMGLKCGAGNIIRLLLRKESVMPLAYLPLFHFYRNAGIEMQTRARARADARVPNQSIGGGD